MKKAFYISALLSVLVSCSENTEKKVENSIRKSPQQIKLSATNIPVNPGDYYLSAAIDYSFSGEGDENSMDETPYLTPSARLILDSVADFMKHNPLVRFRIYSLIGTDSKFEMPTFDSCVPCSFEEEISNYLISKGIDNNRVVWHYNDINKDRDDNLNAIRAVQPLMNSLNQFVLLVNDTIP